MFFLHYKVTKTLSYNQDFPAEIQQESCFFLLLMRLLYGNFQKYSFARITLKKAA